jgi:hypothetical protein
MSTTLSLILQFLVADGDPIRLRELEGSKMGLLGAAFRGGVVTST